MGNELLLGHLANTEIYLNRLRKRGVPVNVKSYIDYYTFHDRSFIPYP